MADLLQVEERRMECGRFWHGTSGVVTVYGEREFCAVATQPEAELRHNCAKLRAAAWGRQQGCHCSFDVTSYREKNILFSKQCDKEDGREDGQCCWYVMPRYRKPRATVCRMVVESLYVVLQHAMCLSERGNVGFKR